MASTSNDIKYKADQLVLTEFPLLYSLSLGNDNHCAGCFKSSKNTGNTLKKCGKCGYFNYCSLECQQSDWNKFHKMECKIYAKRGSSLENDFFRLSLRALLLQIKRPKELNRRVKTLNGGERCFNDLVDHQERFSNNFKDSEKLLISTLIFTVIGIKLDPKVMEQIMIKLLTNSLAIYDSSLTGKQQIGTGVYLSASVLDQSCDPNAIRSFDGLQLQTRTLKNIPANEPLTPSFVSTTRPTLFRQATLYDNYHFICKCPRCLKYENDLHGEAKHFPRLEKVEICQIFSQMEKVEPVLDEKERLGRFLTVMTRAKLIA